MSHPIELINFPDVRHVSMNAGACLVKHEIYTEMGKRSLLLLQETQLFLCLI